MSGILEIGTRGILATQLAMDVSAQNIANADKPSYSRREANFKEVINQSTGEGVFIAGVKRLSDAFAVNEVYNRTTQWSKSNTFFAKTSDLESLFDKDTSVASSINNAFSALESININPSAPSLRRIYLAELNAMTSFFNQATRLVEQEHTEVAKALNQDATVVNQITQELALINSQIVALPEDARISLKDRREELLTSLSGYLDNTVTAHDNGAVDVILSNGVPLIQGNVSEGISFLPSPTVAGELDGFVGNRNVTNAINGGHLAGLLAYQRGPLEQSERALARLELVIGQQFNAQNKLGIDLKGQLGKDIFNDINSFIAMANRVNAYRTNSGNAELGVKIVDAKALSTSNYSLVFSSSTDYQLTRLSDGNVVTSGSITSQPCVIQADGYGITIPVGASFSSGDGFTISPTNSKAALLSVSLTDPDQLALGLPVEVFASELNQGSGRLDLTAVVDTSNPSFATPLSLSPPILVKFLSETEYQLVDANNPSSVIETNLSYDSTVGKDVFPTPGGFDPGYRIHLSGAIQSGDEFNVAYNLNGVGDNRNGLLVAKLFQTGCLDNGQLNYIEAFRQLSHEVSLQANIAHVSHERDSILKAQAETRKDQVSGVSLQEETLHLTQLQQAYQANAKLIEVAQKMFDMLMLSLSRG